MSNITKTVVKMKSFYSIKPSQLNDIESAEQELSLKFSEDYKECLIEFGQFSVYGHELTGITKNLRLNVVEITKEERSKNQFVPLNLYVIEQTHIDDIVIWQNEDGGIYQTISISKPVKVSNSLLDYLNDVYE